MTVPLAETGKGLAKPRQILYATLSPFVGGAERSLIRIAETLSPERFDPFVVHGLRGDFPAALSAAKLKHRRIPMPYPSSSWPFPFMIAVARHARECHKRNVELVHVNDVPAYPVPGLAAKFLDLPRICHVRYKYSADGFRWYLKHGFDTVIFASAFMKDLVQESCPELFPDEGCRVIHNGFDAPPTPQADDLSALKAELGLTESNRTVGFFGRVIPVKGVEQFLAMAARLARRDGDLRFLVVGDDKQEGNNFRHEMEALAVQLDVGAACQFTGFRSDVWNLLHLCDLVVMPSHFEPLGNVLLEAGAAGRPVVASNTGGIPEILVDGETGFLVPTKDVEALERQAWNLLSNPQLSRDLGDNARVRVSARFGLRHQVTQLENLYMELLDAPRKRDRAPN